MDKLQRIPATLRRQAPTQPAANDSQDVPQNTKVSQMVEALEKTRTSPPPVPKDDPKTFDIPLNGANDAEIGNQETLIQQGEAANDSAFATATNTKEISSKLTTLSNQLKEKYTAANDSTIEKPDVAKDTTSEILQKRKMGEVETPKSAAVEVVKQEPKPSEGLLDQPNQVKGAPSGTNPVITAVDAVTTAVKTGFGKITGFADKISSFLFKTSITEAAKGAMIAAAILGIIIALDVLQALWQKYGDLILAKIEDLKTVLVQWWTELKDWAASWVDMKNSFDIMEGSLDEMKKMWKEGNLAGLAGAVGRSLKDGIMALDGVFSRSVAKLLSTVLGALGFKDMAKRIEASGLQDWSNGTKGSMSKDNQTKLAKQQIEDEKGSGRTPTSWKTKSWLPDKANYEMGYISKDEYGQIEAEKKDKAQRQALPYDQQVQVVAAGNEARNAIDRYKTITARLDPKDPASAKRINDLKQEAVTAVNNPALDNAPNVKAELQNQINNVGKQASVSPETSGSSLDTIKAKAIKAVDAVKGAAATAGAILTTPAAITTNIIKNSRSVNVQTPVTNTRAPGVYKATGVN